MSIKIGLCLLRPHFHFLLTASECQRARLCVHWKLLEVHWTAGLYGKSEMVKVCVTPESGCKITRELGREDNS